MFARWCHVCLRCKNNDQTLGTVGPGCQFIARCSSKEHHRSAILNRSPTESLIPISDAMGQSPRDGAMGGHVRKPQNDGGPGQPLHAQRGLFSQVTAASEVRIMH
jgi:hypothetical protein